MKITLHLGLVATLLAVVLPAVRADTPKKVELSKAEQTILDLVNAAREKEGASPLTAHPILLDLARSHSANMAKQQKLSHDLDGMSPFDRMKAAGYASDTSGENVAGGGELDARGAFELWMKSPGHRANILNKEFREFGIGLARDADGGTYYTGVFGSGNQGPSAEEKEAALFTEAKGRLVRLVNAARDKEKLPALTVNAKLATAAQLHAANMAKQAKLEHVLDGKGGPDRVKEAGYAAEYGGQLIGWSARLQVQETFEAWTDNKDQRGRMLNPAIKEIGVGLVRESKGEFYYCLVFGAGEKAPAADEKAFEETAEKILELTNAARKKEGLTALTTNTRLAGIARQHSGNMAKQDKMEHVLDAKAPPDRALAGGYDYSYVGENLAMTDGDPPDVIFKLWMESKLHREQIMNPNFREMGLGLVRDGKGRLWYTQLFGTQRKK